MNPRKDSKLREMEGQAHIIEDPAKKEARAAAQLDAVRQALDNLPRSVKRKIRQHVNRRRSIVDLLRGTAS